MVEDAVWEPSATDSVVKFLTENVCPWLPLSAKCLNLAEGLVPVFINWVRSYATPNALCSSLDGCAAPDKTPSKLVSATLRGDTSGCAMCTYIVQTAKDALEHNSNVQTAVAQARQACVELPQDLTTTCATMVDTFGPALMASPMSAAQLCHLGLGCKAQPAVMRQPLPWPAAAAALLGAARQMAAVPRHQAPLKDESCDVCKLDMLLGQSVVIIDQLMHTSGLCMYGQLSAVIPHHEWFPGSPWSPWCQMAVMEARTLATDPTTQASLTNYTLSLCDQFPTVVDECKLYVNAYAPLVFSLLDVYLVPEVLCAQIGVCPPPPAPPLQLQQRLQQQQPAKYQQLMSLAAASAAQVAVDGTRQV